MTCLIDLRDMSIKPAKIERDLVQIWEEIYRTRSSHNPSPQFRGHGARFSVITGFGRDYQSQIAFREFMGSSRPTGNWSTVSRRRHLKSRAPSKTTVSEPQGLGQTWKSLSLGHAPELFERALQRPHRAGFTFD